MYIFQVRHRNLVGGWYPWTEVEESVYLRFLVQHDFNTVEVRALQVVSMNAKQVK